ncbi:non-hydrolyzing UDP-N-acetylglucosamine 2-epimerase [Bdellovibrio bacteriovorus]|uniref:non-hydrolyzing UDP-N-acetylglucosamine 2-epimerase n=1 Tax=Bdellovibrio bacteriovorus TaxID=959 RepID=UPI0035A92012
MAPLILKARNSSDFEIKVCVTGQHRQMLDQALSLFGIAPDFDLNIMHAHQTLNDITKNVISGLDSIFSNHSFDCVLVHGDTTTTMGASLAAFHRRIPIGHVEAGLRTHNMYSPWPEEMNRRVAGLLSAFHFAPTDTSRANLLAEKILSDHVYVTGNTVIDALHLVCTKISEDSHMAESLRRKFNFLDSKKRMILVTGHRRENFGSQFEDLCYGLKKIATTHDVQVVYPVHLNPNVQEPVKRILGDIPNVFLLEPQDYVPFIFLMKEAYLIVTDSGGVQEEAPSLGKPVLVMRETTERPEAVVAGTVKLVGPVGERIYQETSLLLDNENEYLKMKMSINPYGDGKACERILEILKNEIRI